MPEPAAANVSLRPVGDDDDALLDELFASTRELELSALPAEMRGAFVGMQRLAQERGWAGAFPRLQRWVVVVDGQSAGRLYVDTADDITIVDITLLPAVRGQGVGTRLVVDVLRDAAERGSAVLLSVEPGNPAIRVYERLGFAMSGGDETRMLMRWTS